MTIELMKRIHVDEDLDISTFEDLRQEAFSHALGVDLETTGLDPTSDSIQVVSLATPRTIVTVSVGDRPPHMTRRLLEDTSFPKIFHHALFDMSFLQHNWDAVTAPIVCTKVAARVAGFARNPQLVDLVRHFIGVELDKSQQRSDWSTRPLSKEQLDYAAADVEHLLPLSTELMRLISDAGRSELFASCMSFLPTRVELGLTGLDDVFAYEI